MGRVGSLAGSYPTYLTDLDDDWLAERAWRKANPKFGVSVRADDLRALATKAHNNMPAAAAAFKQKRLNLWVNAGTPWLSLDGWRRGQTVWTPESMAGALCFIGIDLSSKIDLTAVVLVFPPTAASLSWRLVPMCLTPEDTLDEREHRDRAPYRRWVPDGFLRTNPGNRIDQGVVRALVHDAAQRYDVQQVGIDPWNAGNLVTDLVGDGLQVVEIPQTLPQMTAPAKDFEADVLDGLVDAGGNLLMSWRIRTSSPSATARTTSTRRRKRAEDGSTPWSAPRRPRCNNEPLRHDTRFPRASTTGCSSSPTRGARACRRRCGSG